MFLNNLTNTESAEGKVIFIRCAHTLIGIICLFVLEYKIVMDYSRKYLNSLVDY